MVQRWVTQLEAEMPVRSPEPKRAGGVVGTRGRIRWTGSTGMGAKHVTCKALYSFFKSVIESGNVASQTDRDKTAWQS